MQPIKKRSKRQDPEIHPMSTNNSILNASDFASRSSTTSGIQEAINALPTAGGTVFIQAGRYLIRRSIVLRSNVTLCGEGASTIITRPREIVSKVTKRISKNRTYAYLEDTKGLKVGDEIMISDDEQRGYWARHGILQKITSDRVNLELLECDPEKVYLPSKNAIASNYFPGLWLPRVAGVTIKDLTIDGCTKRHRAVKGNFTNAAVHSRNSNDIRILNVTVRNWQADGIGVQGGESAMVSGCTVDNCRGPGLHPGTSIQNSIWSNNISRNNTTDGFFFCLGVVQAVVEGNLFFRNRGHGMANLTDPDRYNVLKANICAENGQHGIEATRSLGNVIQGNILRNNSQENAGKYAGIYLEGHKDNDVSGNVFIDDQDRPTQTHKIISLNPTGENVIQEV